MGFKLTSEGWIGKHGQRGETAPPVQKKKTTEAQSSRVQQVTEEEEEEEEEEAGVRQEAPAQAAEEEPEEDSSSEAPSLPLPTQPIHLLPSPPTRPRLFSPIQTSQPKPSQPKPSQPKPSQPKPSQPSATNPPNRRFILDQFQELQAHLETILASNFSSLTTKIDHLEHTFNYKYDLLRTQIESLQPSHPAPSAKLKGVVIQSPHSSSDKEDHLLSPQRPTDILSTSHPPPIPSPPIPVTHHSQSPVPEVPSGPASSPRSHQTPSPVATAAISASDNEEVGNAEPSPIPISDSASSASESSQPISFILKRLSTTPALPPPTQSLLESSQPSPQLIPPHAVTHRTPPQPPSDSGPIFMTNQEFNYMLDSNTQARAAWDEAVRLGTTTSPLQLPYPLMTQPEYLTRIQCTGPPRPYSSLFPPDPSEPYLIIPPLSRQPMSDYPFQDPLPQPPTEPPPETPPPPTEPPPETPPPPSDQPPAPPPDPSPSVPPPPPSPSIQPLAPIFLTYAELVHQTQANSEACSAWIQAFHAGQASPSDLRLPFPNLSLPFPFNRVQITDLTVRPPNPEPPIVIPPLDPLPSPPPSPPRPSGASHRRRAVIGRRHR